MTDPLTSSQLDAMTARDLATADGVSTPDYECAGDRHLLLIEVHRLRSVIERLASGRPTATY